MAKWTENDENDAFIISIWDETEVYKYIPCSTKLEGVYWFHHIRLSVRLWTESSPLCNFHYTILAGPISFHIYTLYQEGVLCVNFLSKIFAIVFLNL